MVTGHEKGYWEIITVTSGVVEEKSKSFISSDPVKSIRCKKTSAKKQALNEKDCVRRMARSLNANFIPGDILLGLDYSENHYAAVEARARKLMAEAEEGCELSWEDYIRMAATHELTLCMDRVRRFLKKEDVELKYLAITSDMDGKTGEMVRIHHHVVIPRNCLEAFKAKWGKGRVKGKPIEQELDHTQIAEYLCAQVRRVPDAKKYMPSRNLKKPKVKRRIVPGNAELRVPKGCELLYRGAHEPGWTSQYIRYFRPLKQ